jgi:WD40 repeat protein
MRRAGWGEGQQLLLRDLGAADPGRPDSPAPEILPLRRNLDWAFNEWLFPKARPGDLVVLYFAGRARAVVKPQGPRVEPRWDYYLLPTDTIAGNIELQGWSLDRAVETCVRRRLQVVCWLATSMSTDAGMVPVAAERPGAPTPRQALAKGVATAQAAPPGSIWLAMLTRWRGVTAWLAADGRPVVDPSDDPGAPFTRALLQALAGPDQKRNLATCLRELHGNAQLRVLGFRAVGGVPPELSLWKDDFSKDLEAPKPELVVQVGHADKITALAVPADGRQLISASMDATVRIWSVEDRSLLRILPDQLVGATSLAMSRDDRWLVSGGASGSVQIYERSRDYRRKPYFVQPHLKRVEQIVLLPDGVHFVSVDQDALTFLWDLNETKPAPKPWLAGAECLEIACGGKPAGDGKDNGVILARTADGKVRLFDSAGKPRGTMEVADREPTAAGVSPDGRLLAVGFSDGSVVVRDRDSERLTRVKALEEPRAVRRLVLSPAGKMVVGHDKGASLISLAEQPGNPAQRRDGKTLTERPLESAVFSPSGEYLAACTQNVGALLAWRVDAGGAPSLLLDEPDARACTLGFSSDGRGLVIGNIDGGLAHRPLDRQAAQGKWELPANRGKLRELSASSNRSHLCVRDEQRRVRIWDLKERTCRRLRGTWSSCAFLDENRVALVADRSAHEHAGRLVLFDRRRVDLETSFFTYSAVGFRVPEALALDRLAVSPDGKRIAATGDPSKEPLVCVWETRGGGLTHWIPASALDDAVTSLCFSTDGRYLLTAGGSPHARLWDLSANRGSLVRSSVTFSDPMVQANVTCAALRPNHPRQVVTGHSDGQVHLWGWAEKAQLEAPGVVAGEFPGPVNAISFSHDGKYMAAAGNGPSIWLGTLDPRPRSIDVLVRLRPHHFEQVNALAFWPGEPILISASDDTTVRFWDLKAGALRGTFASASKSAVSDIAAVQELDWVLYTPDGRFDAPPAATKLVRYRRQDQPMLLERFEKTSNVFRLAEQLIIGATSRRDAEPADPPPVTLSAPPRPDPTLPETTLTVALGAEDLKDVRLYHNDVLIPTGRDETDRSQANLRFDVAVHLVPDRNRFYIMASKEGAYDSCSNIVEVDCAAPMERGQLHILALGVGGYEQRRLHYAGHDAERLSDVLHARGVDAAGRRGIRIVLPETELNVDSVERAFDQIARRVEDRPQDTVVVFLAGHTGVFDPQRFCLLLPSFPFPKQAPIAEGEPIIVAARDAPVDADVGAKIDPRFVLPYSVIALNLMKLKALNRLVIVDACQAEAILEDNQVRAIQRWMELSSRRARTSYLMAARRGEPALEIEPLAHGLFTYTLLLGMGAVSAAGEPPQVKKLNLPPNADFDRNGILSTSELDAFVKQALPEIAALFPQVVAAKRAATVARAGTSALVPEPLDQALRLQTAEASFPLVPLGNPSVR